ncbi:copper amine oxidase N-terminal domain-containing protein [Paenibacillus alvei]|nr:copper amine oxidase N-terminal domain-containing protein [Paenibacillus alvei]MCY9757353.1 copper amine oxidase N-terminal domain-containing protein [Paenibacillus alvei]
MKKVTLLMATMLTAVSIVAPVSAAPKYDYNVRIDVNKQPMKSDVLPFIDQTTSRTYVPIRFVSEALGEKVTWNNKTKTVTVSTVSGKKIELSRGQKFSIVDGKKKEIDAPSIEVQNRVMVPLRFVSEQIGAVVDGKKSKGWTYVSIAYAGAPKPDKEQPGKEDGKGKTYSSFELDKKYNTLAPYLFKDNMKVQNGELYFKVPDVSRVASMYIGDGKRVELKPGNVYHYALGSDAYIGFSLSHKDENVESYFIYLSPKHDNLKGDFNNVSGDAIVAHELDNKRTASPLTDVKKMF